MSIWQDVAHDPGLAAEAIDELERTAAHLDGLTRARRRVAEQATTDWHGVGRQEFDQHLTLLLHASSQLVADLRQAADRIADETEQATSEQRRRERARTLMAGLETVPG